MPSLLFRHSVEVPRLFSRQYRGLSTLSRAATQKRVINNYDEFVLSAKFLKLIGQLKFFMACANNAYFTRVNNFFFPQLSFHEFNSVINLTVTANKSTC